MGFAAYGGSEALAHCFANESAVLHGVVISNCFWPAAGFRPQQAEGANGIVACQLRFVDGSQSLSQPSGSRAAVGVGASELTAIRGFGSSGRSSNLTLRRFVRIGCGMIVFVAKIKA